MGRARLSSLLHAATYAGSALAVVGAGHAAVNARLLRRPLRGVTFEESVSVLLPVRDEVRRVEHCLRSLLTQEGLSLFEILVLDDGSVDGTGDAVRRVAGDDPRVRLIDGAALPDGWLGKPHACFQLGSLASGTVLVFVDADVVLSSDAVAATADLLRRSGLQLVSPYPRQHADGVAARLMQPLLQWSWMTFLPLRLAETSLRPSLSAANGQLLCVDAAAYRSCGGHGAEHVRHAVLEDLELLKAFKRNGFRGVVVDGSEIATCRMYDSPAELREGYAKSLWAAFGSPSGAAAVCGLLLVAYVVPLKAAILDSDRRLRVAGTLGFGAGVAGRVVAGRRTGSRIWPDAFAHPASIVAFVWLTAYSFVRHRKGSLTWKGRLV